MILCAWLLPGWAAEPYCNVATYGYEEGLPAASGSRVVQGPNGFMWIATWNGLYRFDGYGFYHIRPDKDSEVRKYSSRFRDIKMGPDGKMWCRIDDNIVLFDVDNYKFHDLHSLIERKLGKKIKIDLAIRETTEDDIVLQTTDGQYLIFDARKLSASSDPVSTLRVVAKDAPISLKSADFFKTPLPPSFSRNDVAYTKKDETGNIWCITKDGRIMMGTYPDDHFKVMATIDVGGSPIKYSCEDNQGNVWMLSNAGAHKIALGSSSLSYLTPPQPSQLRASMIDSQDRIWLSWSDSEYVCVLSNLEASPYYVGPDGHLSLSPIKFGHQIYSMTIGPDGQIWLGSKPDGLYRLTPKTDGAGYSVDHFKSDSPHMDARQYDNYYDMAFDKRGRLWLATLGNGVEVIVNPSAPTPRILSLIERKEYPQEAYKTRRVRIVGDTLVIATTTEGLLSFPMPSDPKKDKIDFTLHRTMPGDEYSLGNIATMDVAVGSENRLYIATESDGVNMLVSPLMIGNRKEWKFSSFKTDFPAVSETALTLSQLPDERLLVVGKKNVNLIHPSADMDIEELGPAFWKRDIAFKEVRPLQLSDGRWLLGLTNGAVAIDLNRDINHDTSFPIYFTSYNIEGGPTLPMSLTKDTITLYPGERAMTLTFAALCYSDAETVRYAYRLNDDEEWRPLGALRTLTFTRLEPGRHTARVKSTDVMGRWLDNERTITIDVRPTFKETIWAKILLSVIILAVVVAACWIIIYMRRIKRKQRETLEAYLNLLEARTSATFESRSTDVLPTQTAHETEPVQSSAPRTPADLGIELSEEDKTLISKVVDFIDQNLSDSSITVDDMAEAVALSKSSLTRKMKSLMGVTPADFLKSTRLSKSKIMLKENSRSIKEIAFDCGFSDMNYFGKCFKSAFGTSPGNYRKES